MGNIIKAEELNLRGKEMVCVIHTARNTDAQQNDDEPNPEQKIKMILDQARRDAQEIIQEAEREAESIREKGYQDGYNAGHEEALRDRERCREQYAKLEAEIVEKVQVAWAELEPEIIMLSIDIAKKIVRHEIDKNDKFVLGTVREALRQLRERKDIKILVNPEDYRLVLSCKEEIKGYCDGMCSIEVIENRRTDKGGCLIESGNGDLDARIATQLGIVEKSLMEIVHDGKDGNQN